MGMFDTVYIVCPYCENTDEQQTKNGPCTLGEYTLQKAPMSVLAGIVGLQTCMHCEKQYEVRLIHQPLAVAIKAEDGYE